VEGISKFSHLGIKALKHGSSPVFHPGYGYSDRGDVVEMIPLRAARILDVGCCTGMVARHIRERLGPHVEVAGVEIHSGRAKLASRFASPVIVADADTLQLGEHFPEKHFDCILFADVLEHMKDPWSFLQQCRDFLADGGVIIASIPNVRHWSTFYSVLVKNRWPYCESGIHDRTHLRFFTFRNIEGLFRDAGFQIVRVERNFGAFDDEPSRKALGIPRLAILDWVGRTFRLPLFLDLVTVQYRVVAKKKGI
jgi:SAM-dependent methyltransferase